MFRIQQFQFENPQMHQFEDKNDFIDSKDPVSILLWSQGYHIMGHLWIQTDHNLDHKCPDYGQPVTKNMYDQSMISPESCSINYGRVWSVCFCMGGQPGVVYFKFFFKFYSECFWQEIWKYLF